MKSKVPVGGQCDWLLSLYWGQATWDGKISFFFLRVWEYPNLVKFCSKHPRGVLRGILDSKFPMAGAATDSLARMGRCNEKASPFVANSLEYN